MIRNVVVACLLALLGGCSTVEEFRRINPEEIAVIIGYEVVGSRTLHPTWGFVVGIAAGIAAGPVAPLTGGLIAGTTTSVVSYAARSEHGEMTMTDELNSAIYQQVAETLEAKGYKVKLLKMMPITYEFWDDRMPAESVPRHLTDIYGVDPAALTATYADALLLLEYRVDAYVKTPEELQTLTIETLVVDGVMRLARAYALSSGYELIFDNSYTYVGAFSRMDYDKSLEKLASMKQWPESERLTR